MSRPETQTSGDDAHLAALDAARRFQMRGRPAQADRFRRGHIHATFVVDCDGGEPSRRYLLQRLNRKVFPDLDAVMQNVELVTAHLGRKGLGDSTVELVRTLDGGAWLDDGEHGWRCYAYVDDSEAFDLCDSPERAFAAARAFGRFQTGLADLDPAQLSETIPDFFPLRPRLEKLAHARQADAFGRCAGAADALAFVQARSGLVDAFDRCIAAGAAPDRVLHGDTKLNNVLFRSGSNEAICVVDLDTCMAGWSGYDIGDLVRFTAATAPEDETDLSRVATDLDLYRALVEGYLDGASSFLGEGEIAAIPLAARIVTFTIGVRFLTDHLAGDQYFGAAREGQNLDRARVQFRLVESMEGSREAMRGVLPVAVRGQAERLDP